MVLLLSACPPEDIIPDFKIIFRTHANRTGQNAGREYLYVHGLGMTDTLRMKSDPKYYGYRDTFYYLLPLNSNADSTYFVFHWSGGADTLGLSYRRKFYVRYNRHGYGFYRYDPENLRISYLSARFNKDSCEVAYNDWAYENRLNLVLKP